MGKALGLAQKGGVKFSLIAKERLVRSHQPLTVRVSASHLLISRFKADLKMDFPKSMGRTKMYRDNTFWELDRVLLALSRVKTRCYSLGGSAAEGGRPSILTIPLLTPSLSSSSISPGYRLKMAAPPILLRTIAKSSGTCQKGSTKGFLFDLCDIK